MKIAAAGSLTTLAARVERAPRRAAQSAEENTGFYRVLTYFRATNAEALRLLQGLKTALEVAKTGVDRACASAFEQVRDVIRAEIEEAGHRAADIEELHQSDPGTEAWYARELVQVSNGWDDLNRLWGPEFPSVISNAELVKRGLRSVEVLEDLIFLCACQTIPDELTHYLENYRIGTCLDFIATFKDQLSDEAATRRVLATLAPQSALVPGLIDVKNAKVIKADKRAWRQLLSMLVIATTAVLGFFLIGVAVHLGDWLHFNPAEWTLKPDMWSPLNGGYLLILTGVLAHWVLERVKQNRAGSDVTPFSEWLLWMHVNEVPITVRIMSVWLLLGMGIAFKTFNLSQTVQPVTYFTAGYFIDSTFDALIGKFNTFVTSHDPVKQDGKSGNK